MAAAPSEAAHFTLAEAPMGDKDYAIVVGISHYYHHDLGSMDGAVEDAKKFAVWLASPSGGHVPTRNIKLILSTDYDKPKDFGRAQPLKKDIDDALREFGMNQTIRSSDRLYLYFTGHGLGLEFDDAAMLLANASREYPYDNLGFRKYRIHLRKASRYKNLIFFLDCCRNLDTRVEGQGPHGPMSLTLTADAFNVKDYVFFATLHGRQAFEPPHPVTKERRGLFTQALLEALDEKKGADPFLRVTAGTLKRYLSERVPQLAEEAGLPRMQEPESLVDDDDFLFGCSESPPKVSIRVTAHPSLGGFFILYDGNDDEIARYDVAGAPWDFELPVPRLFTLRHSPSQREEIINTRKIRDEPHVYHFGP